MKIRQLRDGEPEIDDPRKRSNMMKMKIYLLNQEHWIMENLQRGPSMTSLMTINR